MKKLLIVMALALTATFANAADNNTQVNTQASKEYRREALALKQQLMNKNFEIEKEYLKDTPDKAAITKLTSERDALRTKLIDANKKYGYTDRGMGRGMGMGHGKGYGRGMGHGAGMGSGMMNCPNAM